MTSEVYEYSKLIEDALDPLIPTGAPIALFDFPNYSNVGDSAIWLGEIKYLKNNHPQSEIIFCDCKTRLDKFPKLTHETIIFINGGGNFGDLWKKHQIFRLNLLKHYLNHRIIQFPQSIHFENKSVFEETRNVLASHPDFHLFVRDQKSLSIAQSLHNGHCELCPDMALYLGNTEHLKTGKKSKIVALMRTDKEKVIDITQQSDNELKIMDWTPEPPFAMRTIYKTIQRLAKNYPLLQTLILRHNYKFFIALSSHRIKRGCAILSSGQVVITDRLHAHILCTMMKIPHVVIDNSYQKIGSFRDFWQTGLGICETAICFEEAVILANKISADQTKKIDEALES